MGLLNLWTSSTGTIWTQRPLIHQMFPEQHQGLNNTFTEEERKTSQNDSYVKTKVMCIEV